MVNNNLGPEAQKWARGIDSAIAELQRGSNGSIEFQRNSVAQYDAISTAIKNIQEQQAALTGVVNSIPVSQVYQVSTENFTVMPNVRTVLELEVVPPAGKTTASVFATASANYNFSGAQSNVPWWDITINTDVGQRSTDSFWKMDTYSSVVMHSDVVSWDIEEPLTSFPVTLKSHSGQQVAGTTPGNKAQLQVIVVFS